MITFTKLVAITLVKNCTFMLRIMPVLVFFPSSISLYTHHHPPDSKNVRNILQPQQPQPQPPPPPQPQP